MTTFGIESVEFSISFENPTYEVSIPIPVGATILNGKLREGMYTVHQQDPSVQRFRGRLTIFAAASSTTLLRHFKILRPSERIVAARGTRFVYVCALPVVGRDEAYHLVEQLNSYQ